ncbi:glycosyltransferase [Plantactinospora siamensis]|uniref:Glycosyltransferase n=1 Tax=Plantactinospora siamensis TaxID=555372 RepID=A0ABV6P161_9ACTN
MAPRLSVVVPFYNVEDYIGDCLDSLARQTFGDFEVILVDDGSRDGSARIAESWCERDGRFRVVRQENQGLGPARNTGARHAQGEYLTFVDSDDLVTRHAYETMVRTLDETGSSFAAGDARRFNNTAGVRESWVHRIPFAEDRLATHVFEYHPLALDRMVWNKVYRRSFWDEFGYRFPAIRYEDYPVTLRAHVEAVTVDVLSAPVYYWRERESGESITQLKFEYANLYDRVVSAEMVLDLLDEKAPELRGVVHRHFAQIDLAALVQAFSSVPEHEQDKLLQLGHRLSERLDREALAYSSPYERLQYFALQAGDANLLHRLAQFQLDGGLRGGARARRNPAVPWRFENQYPGLDDHPPAAPRRLYRLPLRAMSLHSRVTGIDWDDEGLIVRGTAEIRHLVSDDSSALRIWLVRDGRKTPLPVRRFEALDSHGDPAPVGFEARVSRGLLAAFPRDEEPAHFLVELRRGALYRRGELGNPQPGGAQLPAGDWVADDVWIQPTRVSAGRLALVQFHRPFALTSARVADDAFVLAGRLPGPAAGAPTGPVAGAPADPAAGPRLQLSRTSGAELLPLRTWPDGSGTAFEVRLPLGTLVDAANPDDPFTQQTVRVPSLAAGEESPQLLAAGLTRSLAAVHDGRLLVLTRSTGNYVSLHEGPVRLTADALDLESGEGGHRLTVSGTRWETVGSGEFVWRRFFDNSNDYVDVACKLAGDDRRWSAGVELADLLPPPEASRPTSADPLASLADWTLFAVPVGAESAYAVQTDVFLLRRLPLELSVSDRRIRLQPRVGTLHLEVR